MVVGDMDFKEPRCYFCDKRLRPTIGGSNWSRQKIRTNDGEVIVDTVCDDCNPKK